MQLAPDAIRFGRLQEAGIMKPMANAEMHNLETGAPETKSKCKTASKRRWLQFSIRSLLIATALFAFILGTFMHRARTQEEAVAEIRKLGGRVTYESNWLGHVLPESIEKHLGEDVCANVVSVNLSYQTANRRRVKPADGELEQFIGATSRLPHVTRLDMYTFNLQDDMAKLAPLRNIIEELFIKELFIDELLNGDLGGNSLEHLDGWTQLRSLRILSTGRNATLNVQPLASLPNLTDLSIGAGTLNETAFADLSTIDSLRTLCLNACRFDGEHLRHLRQLPNLDTLLLLNTHAEAEYDSYIIDESGNRQPKGQPTFRFKRSGDAWPSQPKTFPAGRYQQWLKAILPNVQVSEMFMN